MASRKHSAPKSGYASRGFAVIASIWEGARVFVTDGYRPELHYMRGPGPKWQAKHGHLAQASDAVV